LKGASVTALIAIVAMAIGFAIGIIAALWLLKSKDSTENQDNNLQVIDSVFNNATNQLMSRLEHHINMLEGSRNSAMNDLYNQLRSMDFSQQELVQETVKLRTALSSNSFRGQWGEIQLKRVVELAGMVEKCDFDNQVSVTNSDANIRPDMVVHLPNDSIIVVDAKCPLNSYLLALENTDTAKRNELLKQHAKEVERHITNLSSKSYWSQFKNSPEFVVMFMPSEAIFSSALISQPDLIEKGVQDRVIMATPTTLISLLKAVAYGWKQDDLSKNAQQVSTLANELHTRLVKFNDHFLKIGKSINQSVDMFNSAVSSYDTRVVPTLRKFENLAGMQNSVEPPEQLTTNTKTGSYTDEDKT
jgi:DNA recombination protein RmuC